MAVATFSYAVWAARYPRLAAIVTEEVATAYFDEAGLLYLNNTDCSYVEDVAERTLLLGMLVAHIAEVNGASAQGAQGVVGRLSSATQGSVSASFDFTIPPGSAAWYAQTQPGASFWAATAKYRTMRYVPGPQPFLGVPGYGRGPWPR